MKNPSAGFLMSLEAAFALTLLAISASALPAFQLQKNTAPEFFLCSDAALVLVRAGAFSGAGGQGLQEQVGELSGLSGMCIEAGVQGGESASSCPPTDRGKISLSFPVSRFPSVATATVSCWPAG